MKGTIIENSLIDKSILNNLQITKTWTEEDWILHDVIINESQIKDIQKALDNGPWYIHFWEGNNIVVIYKDKIFHINKLDKNTWKEAIEHGKTLSIPEEQLDFLTD